MDLLYLSLQYVRHHRLKLLVLTFTITLVSWLPIAIQSIVDQTAEQLLDRAERTPLVIGAPGSPLELSLGSLYFRSKTSGTIPYSEVATLEQTGFSRAIPLYYRFRVQDYPVVGTSLDYFDYRDLRLARGRPVAILGEAVLGSGVAKASGLGVGDHVITSPESVFDLAGVYPLRMPVVGVLSPSFSPDDDAIFVDVKTSWVIQGLGHGHQELNRREAVGQILKREGDNIVANASVRQFNEITVDNLDSFHGHHQRATHIVEGDIGSANGVVWVKRFHVFHTRTETLIFGPKTLPFSGGACTRLLHIRHKGPPEADVVMRYSRSKLTLVR